MAEVFRVGGPNEGSGGVYTLKEDLHLDETRTKVVKDESSPKAAFLLGRKGDEIPEKQARELGLVKKQSKSRNKKREAAKNKQS